ncbi:fumarylacetoacetate hydrolase family protein [Rathayibacter soli]|uniref:fumarylacetoacetate hydrolase family protein n=1 Tax=Rathayibacter soli TaxID=3144168 RepID=UPI0027E4BF2B|nr:fumarylacetoacetate hydrolase family protein [Glaciibacter superstes]
MQFGRLGPLGAEIPVACVEGSVYDLSSITHDIDGAFLRDDPVGMASGALAQLPLVKDAQSRRIGAPIARPGAIYCIGMNYAAHAREGGSEPPSQIVVFLKPPHTVAGPHDDFIAPRGMLKLDWEVELAVVIGKRAWQLDGSADPLDYVAGYTIANDLSERHWQLEVSGGQWSKGKSGPGFLPLGPWLVPTGEVDPSDLRLQSRVNDQPRQDSRTSDLIFDVPTILRDLSQFTVLEAGDVVLTGTPEGVALSGRFPYLIPGDVMELEIEQLGAQHQRVLPDN